jgi:hypothetical protein
VTEAPGADEGPELDLDALGRRTPERVTAVDREAIAASTRAVEAAPLTDGLLELGDTEDR